MDPHEDFEKLIPENTLFVPNNVLEVEEVLIKSELPVNEVEDCASTNEEIADENTDLETYTSLTRNSHAKSTYFKVYSKPVKVINKSYPDDWTVPNDLSTVVIYTKRNGRRVAFYNGYKYVIKWFSRGIYHLRCFTSLSCKAFLKIGKYTGERTRILEEGVHTCTSKRKNKNQHPEGVTANVREQDAPKSVSPVKIINYLEWGKQFKRLQRLKMIPDFDPNDDITLVMYNNETEDRIIYYKGYEYSGLEKRIICHKSAKCMATLVLSQNETVASEYGTHTCDDSSTTDINLAPIHNSNNRNIVDMHFDDNYNDNSISRTTDQDSQDCLQTEDTLDSNFDMFYIYSKCENLEHNEDDADKVGVEENTGNTNLLDLPSQTSGDPEYIPVTFRFYKNDFVPKLDPLDSSIVSSYFDKVGGKEERVLYYKGHTYVDNNKKTLLYMCSRSIKCYAALKLNPNKTGVFEVGTHKCLNTLKNGFKKPPAKRPNSFAKPNILQKRKRILSKNSRKNSLLFGENQPVVVRKLQRYKETEREIMKQENIKKFIPIKVTNYLDHGEDFKTLQRLNMMPDLDPHDASNVVTYLNESRIQIVYYKGCEYTVLGKVDNFIHNICYQGSRCQAKLIFTLNEKAVLEFGKHTCGVAAVSKIVQPPVIELKPVKFRSYLKKQSESVSKPQEFSFLEDDCIKYVYYKNYIYVKDGKPHLHPLYTCSQSQTCTAAVKFDRNQKKFVELGVHKCFPTSYCKPVQNEPNATDSEVQECLKVELNAEETDILEVKLGVDNENANDPLAQDFTDSVNVFKEETTTDIKIEPEDYFVEDNAESLNLKHTIYIPENLSATATVFEVPPLIKIYSEEELAVKKLKSIDNSAIQSLKESDLGAVSAVNKKTTTNNGHFQDTSKADFKPVIIINYIADGITYDSDNQSENILDLDPCDSITVSVFRDKKRGNICYYRGYKYFYDNKLLSMCTRSPCSAALKIHPDKSSVSEIGKHNCVNNVSGSKLRRLLSDFKRLNKPAEEHDDNLSIFKQSLKRKMIDKPFTLHNSVKNKTGKKSSMVKKFVPVKIINHLLNTIEKVPFEEQTMYEILYSKYEVSFSQIMFKGYMHRIVRSDANDTAPYICTKFYDCKCNGLLLMKKNRVVEYRDHFCKGKESDRFLNLDLNDSSMLVVYYNVDRACSEILFKGFTYRKKWEISNSSQWVCSKPGCYVRLRITDNLVSEVDDHVCMSTAVRNNDISNTEDETIGEEPTKRKTAKFVQLSLIPVLDDKGDPFLIYSGHIYYEVENTMFESVWMCIENKSNKCSALLHITHRRVSSVSKHTCFPEGTVNNVNSVQKDEDNLDSTDPPAAPSKPLSAITQAYFEKNKYWHDVTEDDDKILYYFPCANKSEYAAYKGYIYRRIMKTVCKGYQKWECIYGGVTSLCRGVLTCTDDAKPLGVSKHMCREEEHKNNNFVIQPDENNEQISSKFPAIFFHDNSTENKTTDIQDVTEEQSVGYIKSNEIFTEENKEYTNEESDQIETLDIKTEETELQESLEFNGEGTREDVREDFHVPNTFNDSGPSNVLTNKVGHINEGGFGNFIDIDSTADIMKCPNINIEVTRAENSEDPLETPITVLTEEETNQLLQEPITTNYTHPNHDRKIDSSAGVTYPENKEKTINPMFDDIEDSIPRMIIEVKKKKVDDVIEISSDDEQ